METDSQESQQELLQHDGRGVPRKVSSWLKSNNDTVKNYAQVILLLIGTCWAFYTFVYENRIKPAKEPPEVIITTTLERAAMKDAVEAGKKDAVIAVTAKVTIHNKSKVRLKIYSSWFNISGYAVSPNVKTDDKSYSERIRSQKPDENEVDVSRYFDESDGTIIRCASLLKDSWLEPDEEYYKTRVVFVPADKFELIKIKVDLQMAKDDRFIESHWRVERGELDARTYIRPENCSSCPAEPFRDMSKEKRDMLVERYGLGHTDAEYSLSLWHSVSDESSQQHQ